MSNDVAIEGGDRGVGEEERGRIAVPLIDPTEGGDGGRRGEAGGRRLRRWKRRLFRPIRPWGGRRRRRRSSDSGGGGGGGGRDGEGNHRRRPGGEGGETNGGGFSRLTAISFTVNYLVGTGFLALPWAFRRGGLLLSTLSLVGVVIICDLCKDYVLETMARAETLVNLREGRTEEEEEGNESGGDGGGGRRRRASARSGFRLPRPHPETGRFSDSAGGVYGSTTTTTETTTKTTTEKCSPPHPIIFSPFSLIGIFHRSS